MLVKTPNPLTRLQETLSRVLNPFQIPQYSLSSFDEISSRKEPDLPALQPHLVFYHARRTPFVCRTKCEVVKHHFDAFFKPVALPTRHGVSSSFLLYGGSETRSSRFKTDYGSWLNDTHPYVVPII